VKNILEAIASKIDTSVAWKPMDHVAFSTDKLMIVKLENWNIHLQKTPGLQRRVDRSEEN
jgi:hypothetical protein